MYHDDVVEYVTKELWRSVSQTLLTQRYRVLKTECYFLVLVSRIVIRFLVPVYNIPKRTPTAVNQSFKRILLGFFPTSSVIRYLTELYVNRTGLTQCISVSCIG